MKRITVDDVMFWDPCNEYPRERIEALFAGRESLGWREILALNLPVKDMLWVFLRPEFLSERRLHLLACDFAKRVLSLVPEGQRGIAENALRVKRLWVDGQTTNEERWVARGATFSAFEVRDVVAALLAASAAAGADAQAAAVNAAWLAAWAAENVLEVSAWKKEPTAQLMLVITALEEEE